LRKKKTEWKRKRQHKRVSSTNKQKKKEKKIKNMEEADWTNGTKNVQRTNEWTEKK